MNPAPAIDNLIDDIRIRASRGTISEFEIAAFKKRAKKLMNADPALAFCALGIIASQEDNEQETRANFQKAIELSADSLIKFNYAVSLGLLGNGEEALTMILEVVDKEKGNLDYLNDAIMITYERNDDRLSELLELWEKQTNGEPHPIVEEMEDVADALEALASIETEGTVSWEQVKADCNLS